MDKKMLFTAGQFAKLHNINKRTLHYYDDIGLFSPAYKGENGYRFYTYLQSPTLEMLLTLRELDMSIEEIKTYMSKRSATAFKKIIDDKTMEIDRTIKRLKAMRKLLDEKRKLLNLCEQSDLGNLDMIECPEEYLLLSRSITGAYDDNDFAVLVEHIQASRDHRLFNKSYGCMISVDKIRKHNFEEYDCFFTKMSNRKFDLYVKPRGNYLRAFCKGNWDKLPETYERMIAYAKAHELILKGYSYEEGINEIAISNMEEYVTQILILCSRKE